MTVCFIIDGHVPFRDLILYDDECNLIPQLAHLYNGFMIIGFYLQKREEKLLYDRPFDILIHVFIMHV